MSEDKHSEDEYEEEAEYSEDEYEEESEDVEGSDEDVESDGAEDAESEEDDMSDWGYAQKKKRFSKEVVLGFGAIALLAGAFFWFSQDSGDDGDPDGTDLAGGPPASDLGESTDPFSDVPGGTVEEVLPGLEDEDQSEPPLLDADPETLLDSDSAVVDSGNVNTSDPRRDVFGARNDGFGNTSSDADLIDSSDATFAQANSINEFGPEDRAAELPNGLLDGDLDSGNSGLTDIDTSSGFSSRPFASEPASSGSFDSSQSSESLEIDFGSDDTSSGTEFRSEPSDSSTSTTLPDLDDTSAIDRPSGLFDESRDGSLPNNGFGSTDSEFGSSGNSSLDGNSFESQPSGNVELMQPEPLSDDTGFDSGTGASASELPLISDNTGLSGGNLPSDGTAFPSSLPEENSFGSSNEFSTETSQRLPFGSDGTSSGQGESFSEPSRDTDLELNNEFQQPTTGRDTRPFAENTFEASTSSSTQFGAGPGSGRYTIQSGDSYWSISKKVYGTPRHFQRLANLNRSVIPNPNRMKPGVVIQVPDASVLSAESSAVARSGNDSPSSFTGQIQPVESADSLVSESSSEPLTGKTNSTDPGTSGLFHNSQGYPMYRVGRGDNLTMIAAQHLGRASRWKQIYHMNRDRLKSPDNLREGLDLKLPADASKVPLVDRTSSLR